MEFNIAPAYSVNDLTGLVLEENCWDSEQLGLTCATICNDELFQASNPEHIWQRIQCLLSENIKVSFITFKIPSDCTDICNILVKQIADFIDVELVYKFANKQEVVLPRNVVFVEKWNAGNFVSLALEMKWSRFFLEKKIPREAAIGLWQSSITNHCQGRADMLAVCLRGNEPAGLATINVTEGERVELFMVGVLPQFQSSGVGTELLQAIIHKYGGDHEIFVETSSNNIAANGLYQKAGFSLYGSRYILHAFK